MADRASAAATKSQKPRGPMTREKINGYRQSESFGSQWIWGALPYFGFSLGVWVLGIFAEFGIPRSLHKMNIIASLFMVRIQKRRKSRTHMHTNAHIHVEDSQFFFP